LPEGFNPSAPGNITDVRFQYGTALTEPNFPGTELPKVPVPEPGILILLGIAMSAIGAASWKISKL
jgi:hypothetical protein